jgi:hypothetical protein
MAFVRPNLVNDAWESKDFKAESLRLFGFHDRGSLVGFDVFDDFEDDRWRYEVDNAFDSALDFVHPDQSDRTLQACCQSCNDMLFGGQSQQRLERHTPQNACQLCNYVEQSLRAHGLERSNKASLSREGSYLMLGTQKVFTIRRPAGEF